MYTKLNCKLLTVSIVSPVANVTDLWAQFGAFETSLVQNDVIQNLHIRYSKKE